MPFGGIAVVDRALREGETVTIGPFENAALAHEKAEELKKYLAALVREVQDGADLA